MEPFTGIGRMIVLIGLILVVIGLFLMFGSKIFPFGRLPGDIIIKKEHFTFYFPLVSMLLISVVLTLVLYILRK